MSNLLSYLLILVPGAVWGASFIATRLILPYLNPFSIAFIRSAISAIFLLILLTLMGSHVHRDRREWASVFILSACNITAFTLTAWGQLYISGGLATILAATIPFFTVIVAHYFTADDKINGARVLGIAMGLCGVVVLVGAEALTEVGSGLWGQLAILTASLLYGISGIYARPVLARQPKESSPWTPRIRILTMQFIMSASFMLPFMLIFDRPWTEDVPLRIFGYLVFLGIGVTSGATMVYYYLIQTHGSTLASMTMYVIPISGGRAGCTVAERGGDVDDADCGTLNFGWCVGDESAETIHQNNQHLNEACLYMIKIVSRAQFMLETESSTVMLRS